MSLATDTPGEWLERYLSSHPQSDPEHEEQAQAHGDSPRRLVAYDEVIGSGGLAERLFTEWVADGMPRAVAGTYLAGWFPGILASKTTFGLIGAGAAFLPERQRLAWWLHPAGWTDGTAFDPETHVLVLPGHPWVGQAGVEVVATAQEQHSRLVTAVIASATPIIEWLYQNTSAGRFALWHEVSDGFANPLAYQESFALTADQVEVVRSLVAQPGVPWKRKPRLEFVAEEWGTWCIFQKGGCCLHYIEHRARGGHHDDDHENDDDHREFHALFPEPEGAEAYCSNCKFRPWNEVRDIQQWWRRREADNRRRRAAQQA
ncbi:MAG: hypothetical protein KF832_20490 [Caldilineaceae bacterium]|nr:hypothetical protein [Caldilineaceae bacterium]